jgi:hypothetical protein
MNSKILKWHVSCQYVIYKPEAGDDYSDCFHLINCENGCSVYRVRDWTDDPTYVHMVYGMSVFYLVNSHKLLCLKFEDPTEYGAESEV